MKFLDKVILNPPVQLKKGDSYPFIEMANVESYKREPGKIDIKVYSSGSRFEDGDTVIARITPCLQNGKGFYCHNIGKGFGSTEFIVLRPKDQTTDSRYLYYLMQTNYIREIMIKSMVGASGRQRVNNDVFTSIDIPFPQIETQRRIADILSAYDDLIENNRKQIKLLEEAAQRLYKEWFVDLHFPGHEHTKTTDGVPEGWEKDTINSKIGLLSGYAFRSAEFDVTGKYKIVTIKNVKDGQFDGDNVSHITNVPSQMPNYCKLSEGDILLSLTGNVGRVCIIHGDNYLLNQRVAKLESNFPTYAYCLFRSKDMLNEMNNLANGVAQQNLSPIRVGKIQILFPSDVLIQRFEATVQPIVSKTILLNKETVILSQARDRLLPKLMCEEVEVNT